MVDTLKSRLDIDHYHVSIGFPPTADFIFNDPKEAVVKFLDLAGALMYNYIDPNVRISSEASLYDMLDADEMEQGGGIYIQNGPFIQFFVRCAGDCKSATWN